MRERRKIRRKGKNWMYFKKLLGCIIFIIGFMTAVVTPLLFETVITLQGWSKFFADLEWISIITGIVLMAIGAFIFFKYSK